MFAAVFTFLFTSFSNDGHVVLGNSTLRNDNGTNAVFDDGDVFRCDIPFNDFDAAYGEDKMSMLVIINFYGHGDSSFCVPNF